MTTSPAVRPSELDPRIAGRLKRDAQGLVVAVAQQHGSGEVLMVGWMDDEALHRTLTTGRCTYWSRSRQEYWVKGDTSGAQQWVRAVSLDCDGDTLLVTVDQAGSGACHTGDHTCFDAGALPAVVGSAGADGPTPDGPAPDGAPGHPGAPPAPDDAGTPAGLAPTPAADPEAASPS